MALYLLKLLPSMLLLLLLLHRGTTHALLQPYCGTVNSSDMTFKNILDGLLKSIATGASKNGGFFNDTVGTSTGQIHGLAICYADANLTGCNSCLTTVASSITRECPDSKVAGFWQKSGTCFIRYSNEKFFTVANTTHILYNSRNYSDPELFGNARKALFDKLIAKTNASANMMASGEESVTGLDKLYGLLQCTRDLNHQECFQCLSVLINILQQYAYSLGAQLFGFSCYVHFEMGPFMPTQEDYLPSANSACTTGSLLSVQGPNPVPLSADRPSGLGPAPEAGEAQTVQGTGTKLPKKSNTTIIVSVVVGVAALLIVMTTCFWLRKKVSLLDRTESCLYHHGVAFSEHYDLTNIRNATENFSERNMLGRGSIGPVFKETLPSGEEIAVKRLSKECRWVVDSNSDLEVQSGSGGESSIQNSR